MKAWVSILVAAIATLLVGAASAQAASLGEGVSIERSSETGELSAIATDPGATIPAPAGLAESAGARQTALAYADAYGPRFGVAGGAEELEVSAVQPGVAGGKTVRLSQQIAGLPVIGGGLQVNLDDEGALRSITGEAEPDAPAVEQPTISAEEAAATALASVSRSHGIALGELEATTPALSILDQRIMGGPPGAADAAGPQLVWQLEVGDKGAVQTVRDFVAVDARVGAIAVQFPEIEAALNRVVCNANQVRLARVPCTAPFARVEGGAATGDADIDLAYQYAGDTYNLYSSLGRDSIDGAGMQIKSTVKYCPAPPDSGDPPNCPYQNAFWNGQQMVYGTGFAAADDVVGHELTHGVTEFSSHLFYYYQSGAINESLSDVFGELMDQTNGSGNDTAAVKWKIGEDLPVVGAIRDMSNPPLFGDPDKTSSPQYDFDPETNFDIGDNGGVHGNSGVNNKAAFLISDGGSFNGQTVTGIGAAKTERIYYRANVALLGSASDYQDLAIALRQSCSDFVTAAAGGITGADCSQVNKAILATEMDRPPTAAPATTRMPACDEPGDTAPALYTESFENSAEVIANWAPTQETGTAEWYYPPENNPYFDATYATSGTENLWGFDQPAISDTAVEMMRDVRIPLGDGRLRFNHSFGFDTEAGTKYDGGLLEYSTDGGANWKDAGSLITANGYTGAIASNSDNPLAGRVMWTGESAGYRTVQVNLTPLAGKVVRFRFRMATDSQVPDNGWFIDDFQIYRCANHVAPGTAIRKAPKKVKTKKKKAKVKVKLGGTDDTTPSNALDFQCRLDKGKFKTCKARAKFKVKAKPGKGKKHTLQVRALDYSGNPDPSPDRVTFRAIQKPKKK